MLETEHGKLVRATGDGNLAADGEKLSAESVFQVDRIESGDVGFVTEYGKYVRVNDFKVDASGDGKSQTNYFKPERQPDGRWAFRGYKTFYLRATGNGMAANVRAADAGGTEFLSNPEAMFLVRVAPPRATYAGQQGRPARGRIEIPGTSEVVLISELADELIKNDMRLVNSSKISEGQCTIVYPKADEKELKTEFGLLTCARRIGDNVTVQTNAVYGGCDADVSKGAGAECKAGVFSNDLVVDTGSGETKFNVTGPEAEACASVTSDKLCANAGATLASSSFTFTDEDKNGIGIGVSAGVGAGLGGGYEDGVLSGEIDLRLGAGASLSFSVNVEDAKDKVVSAGENGFTLVKGELYSAGRDVQNTFEQEIGPKIADTSNSVVAIVERDGKTFVRSADGTAKDAARETERFVRDAGAATGKVAEDAGREIVSITRKLAGIF